MKLTKLAAILFSIAVLPSTGFAAVLGVNTLSCLRPTGVVGWGDDHIYLLVSVSKPDGSAYAFRVPYNQDFVMNTTPGHRQVGNFPLWQEPLYAGQRAIITVTVLHHVDTPTGLEIQRGEEMARTVSQAMLAAGGVTFPAQMPMLDTIDRQGEVSRALANIATHVGGDVLPGQFVVEVWNNGYNYIQTLFKPVTFAQGGNTGPMLAGFTFFGDHSHYELSVGVNP